MNSNFRTYQQSVSFRKTLIEDDLKNFYSGELSLTNLKNYLTDEGAIVI